MRKATVCSFALVAVGAFVGPAAPAFALVDPDCDEFGNRLGLYKFKIDTPDTRQAYRVSGVTGSGLACSTDIRNVPAGPPPAPWTQYGSNTQFVKAEIKVPPGVRITPAAELTHGRYVGRAVVDSLTWVSDRTILSPALAMHPTNVAAEMTVDKTTTPGQQPGSCPRTPDEVACYKGWAGVIGFNWSWVLKSTDQYGRTRYTLTIGEMFHGLYPRRVPVGLTEIKDFRLCAWQGSGSTCGTGGVPLQSNGTATDFPASCQDGYGLYTATATRRDGQSTAPVSACVPWTDPGNVGPPVEIGPPGTGPIIAPPPPYLRPVPPGTPAEEGEVEAPGQETEAEEQE